MGGSFAHPDLATASGLPAVSRDEPVPISAAAIGDPYVEGHGKCDAGGAGCFLTEQQRSRLVDYYQKEVTNASKEYSTALAEVRFDTLIKKDEDLPAWIGMLVDVIGTVATDGIMSAFKFLRKAAEKDIDEGLDILSLMRGDAPKVAEKPSLSQLVQSASVSDAQTVTKFGVDQAKKQVKSNKAENKDKAETLSYIEQLQDATAVAWEHQWQDPPGVVSDGELIILFHSFKTKYGHTTPRYKAAIEDKISRFKASPVSHIGREQALEGRDPSVTDVGTEGLTLRDTKVVWIQFSDHLPPVLYYYKRDAMDNQADYTKEHLEVTPVGAEDAFHAVKPVEQEFVETAVARHKEVWGNDPEVKGPEELYTFDLNRYASAGKEAAKHPPTQMPADNRVTKPNSPDFGFDSVPWSPMTGGTQ